MANAVFGYQFTPGDVTTLDYFHPSLTGQARLAALTWSRAGGANRRIAAANANSRRHHGDVLHAPTSRIGEVGTPAKIPERQDLATTVRAGQDRQRNANRIGLVFAGCRGGK